LQPPGPAPGKIKTVGEDAIVSGSNNAAAVVQARNSQSKDGAPSSSSQLFYAARVTIDKTAMQVDGKSANSLPAWHRQNQNRR
jgi:hypothetical protein